jgi:hypothetical protein
LTFFCAHLFAQKTEIQKDSLVGKCIERYIQRPNEELGVPAGVNLLLVSKKDSITITSLYSSHKAFEIANLHDLERRVNTRCNGNTESFDSLIVAVYFFIRPDLGKHEKLTLPQT